MHSRVMVQGMFRHPLLSGSGAFQIITAEGMG